MPVCPGCRVCPVCPVFRVEGSGGGECGECGECAPSPIVEHSNTTNTRSKKSPLFAFIVRRWYHYTFAPYKALYLPSN